MTANSSLKEARHLVDKAIAEGVSEEEILAAADHSYQKEQPGSVDILFGGDFLFTSSEADWICEVAETLMRNGFKSNIEALREGVPITDITADMSSEI